MRVKYPKVKKLTKDEGYRLFARQVRQSLQISADDFVRQWKSGELKNGDTPEVMRLAMLMPLGR